MPSPIDEELAKFLHQVEEIDRRYLKHAARLFTLLSIMCLSTVFFTAANDPKILSSPEDLPRMGQYGLFLSLVVPIATAYLWLQRVLARRAVRRLLPPPRSRHPLGHCAACGYDLRSHTESGRCPECGERFEIVP